MSDNRIAFHQAGYLVKSSFGDEPGFADPAVQGTKKSSSGKQHRTSARPPLAKRPIHHALATAAAAVTRAQVSPVELGWAAGFFDADGHLSAPGQKYKPYPNGKPRKPSIRLIVSISQNNREVLEYFQKLVRAHGKIYCQKRNIGQNRQCYALMYDGRHALEVIYLLRPNLHRKQYEADAARELAIKGKLGMYPGPKGFPPDVQRARRLLPKKISRLK